MRLLAVLFPAGFGLVAAAWLAVVVLTGPLAPRIELLDAGR